MPFDPRPLYLRAVWSTSYVNDLPDSAFLLVLPGGTKDSDGKTTPRNLRYFPVKDANGAVDEAHVANALARIPQATTLSPDQRAAAMTKAKAMAAKTSVSGPPGQYAGSAGSGRSAEPLLARSYEMPDGATGYQERTFELIMEVRSSGDGRTLFGRAVPYGVIAQLPQYRERFQPGVFSRQVAANQVHSVKIFDSHHDRLGGTHPIGRTTRLSEQPDGLYGEWSLYDTSRAEDALKLVKAGEVTGLSVGFKSTGGGSRKAEDGVIDRISAHLDHVALTHEPVYAEAQVLGVRSKAPAYEADRERFRLLLPTQA